MYMCAYVYVYVYVYVHVYVYVYVYVHVYVYVYVCVCVCVCVYVCIYVCIYIYIYILLYTCTYLCLHSCYFFFMKLSKPKAHVLNTRTRTCQGPRFNPGRCQLHGLGVRHFKVSGGVPSPPEQPQPNGRLSESNKNKNRHKDPHIQQSIKESGREKPANISLYI